MNTLKQNLPLLVTLFAFLIILGLAIKPVVDPDFWWHLATGRLIWETQSIPQQDSFIYSIPNYPYVYHSWLSYLIMFMVYSIFGLWGASVLYALVITFACVFIYKSISLKNNYVGLILLIPFAAIIIYITGLRPQAYSLLGLSILWYLINQTLKLDKVSLSFWVWIKQTKFYLLFPIFIIWVNIHGGFIWGILLIGLFSVINFIIHKDIQELIYLVITIIGLGLVTLINPYTYRVYTLALQMSSNPLARELNMDWYPLFSTKAVALTPDYLIIQAVFLLFISVITFSKTSKTIKIVTWILFISSIYTHRYLLMLSVVIFPYLLLILSQFFQKATQYFSKSNGFTLKIYLLIIPICIVYLILNNLHITQAAYQYPDQFGYQLVQNIYPYPIVNYFRNNGVPTRLLNDYNYGGYLEWYFPKNQYFADGRMDNFYINEATFLEIYNPLVSAQSGWEDIFKEYDFNGVLLSKKFKLVDELKNNPDWELTLEDENFVFFLPVKSN